MKVFISHSSSDNRFVRTLKDDLNENGIDTWIDEDELNYGDKLTKRLKIALNDSSHFIVILSPKSVDSDWVKFELTEALALIGESIKKIMPIVYHRCEIPYPLGEYLYADLSRETVLVDGSKVIFITDGYADFMVKLRRSIEQNEFILTKKDKDTLSANITIKDGQQRSKENEIFIDNQFKNWHFNYWAPKEPDPSDTNYISEKGLVFQASPEQLKGTKGGLRFGAYYNLKDNIIEGKTYSIQCKVRSEENCTMKFWLWIHDTVGGRTEVSKTDPENEPRTPNSDGDIFKVEYTANNRQAIRIHLDNTAGNGRIIVEEVKVLAI